MLLHYFIFYITCGFLFNLSRKTSYKCNTLLFNENVHRSDSIRLPNDRCYLHLSSSKYYFIKLLFFVHFQIVFSSFPPSHYQIYVNLESTLSFSFFFLFCFFNIGCRSCVSKQKPYRFTINSVVIKNKFSQ